MLVETLITGQVQENSNSNKKADWKNVQAKLFPEGIPANQEWTSIEDIISVLNIIGTERGASQLLYPSGGFTEIEFAKKSREEDCIEVFAGHFEILKPKKLTFHSFEENQDWNFFRLETHTIAPSGVYNENGYSSEELLEIESGKYINRMFWDENEFNGEILPETARIVTRHLNGSFTLVSDFASETLFNSYDDLYLSMDTEEFKNYLENSFLLEEA